MLMASKEEDAIRKRAADLGGFPNGDVVMSLEIQIIMQLIIWRRWLSTKS
jgi:hypothetical protein